MKWESSSNYWTGQHNPWSVCMWPWMATSRCSRLVPDCCNPRDRDINTRVGKRDMWRDRRFPDGQRAAGMQRMLGIGRDHKDHPVKMRMGKRDPGQGRCHGYRHWWQIWRLSHGWRCPRGMWLRGNISHPGPCRRFLQRAPRMGFQGRTSHRAPQGTGVKRTAALAPAPWKPVMPASETPLLRLQYLWEYPNYKYVFQLWKRKTIQLMSPACKWAWAFPGGAGQICRCHCKWKMTLRGISHSVRHTCTGFSRPWAPALVQPLKWHRASLTLIYLCRCNIILHKKAQTLNTLPLPFMFF